MATVPLALRMPESLLEELDSLVPGRHPSRSDAIRRAIELYLYRVACEDDAAAYDRRPLTDSELAVGSNPRDWEATPSW